MQIVTRLDAQDDLYASDSDGAAADDADVEE